MFAAQRAFLSETPQKDSAQVKRKLLTFPAEVLQHLGLFIAFVLLVAANEFAAAHPALTAILVFIFSLPYLVASVASRRASFLYATMLLGAVSYFLACHALGAPGASFPLLSVPLVVALLIVGHYLRKRLGEGYAAYPRTVFRAMNITVAVFAIWALAQVFGLMGQPGWLRYVAGLAYLGYAGLYLAHCIGGAPFFCIYIFAGFLTLGGVLSVGALASARFCWIPAIASATAILLVGTKLHQSSKYRWSRHFFVSSGVAIFVSLTLSLLRWPFLLIDLGLGSLLLWAAYGWFAAAVPNVRQAMLAERVVAKCFFFGALLLSLPLAPLIFIMPAHLYVACAALICSVTFAWITWQRRGQAFGPRNAYVLAAAMFASAGLLGIGRQLPGMFASGWSLAGPLALLIALGLLQSLLDRAKDGILRRGLAAAAVFPAFFAWFIPLLQGDSAVALAAAAVAALAVAALIAWTKDKAHLFAVGPVLAGAVVAAALLSAGQAMAGWTACAAAATAAGAVFAWADIKGRQLTRGAANLAWLILSIAAIVIACFVGMVQVLWALTAVAALAVMISARRGAGQKRDVFVLFAQGLAIVASLAAVVMGPFSGIGPVGAGISLLVLAAAHWLAWALGRGGGAARAACALFALGAVLVIFGAFDAAEAAHARLGAGAGVVLALLAASAAMRDKFPKAAHSAVVTGHMTGIVLACAALIQGWPLQSWYLPLAAAPHILIYALMPRLRQNFGFRLGTGLWLSFSALFCLAAYANTPYREKVHVLESISLLWLAAGYALGRVGNGVRSMPLYICAAVVAGFCGIISLFAPAAEDSWRAFLVNGVAFACLFLILRKDVFVYLLTLSLALMAYDWVKASTSVFTQDVLFYLIIGAAVVGVFFSLPYLKKALARTGSLPMFSIFTWRGELLLAVPIVGLALLLLAAYTMKLTGHPKFCTSCHYMGDYYGSWQHSSHRDVACVECHYEPGTAALMEGKIGGLVQVVKYVSHTYSTRPHALISNNSCMRSGCHAGMDHKKEALLFHGRIRFRHDKHLGEHPRGKQLNCVSCHGHAVRGEHISVTETTCVTCHFHGRQDEPVAAGKCTTCHVLPEKAVTFMGQSFDHRKFLKDKDAVRCEHCHSQVTEGSGAVSATRCRSCHTENQPTQVKDQAHFHLVHVSEGHFDCLQCHDEIRHGVRPMEQQLLARGNCRACHEGERHSVQEKMYAGTAIPGLKAMPDAMYKAGVACDGCHTESKIAGLGKLPFTMKHSGAKQCADCHGKKRYGSMLADWQEDTKDRLGELQPALAKLEKACQSAKDPPADGLAKAKKLLAQARTKLLYISADRSFGAHNYPYVSEALDSAEEDLDDCRSLVAAWNKVAAGSP
jgi:hypothetical protein